MNARDGMQVWTSTVARFAQGGLLNEITCRKRSMRVHTCIHFRTIMSFYSTPLPTSKSKSEEQYSKIVHTCIQFRAVMSVYSSPLPISKSKVKEKSVLKAALALFVISLNWGSLMSRAGLTEALYEISTPRPEDVVPVID